MAFSSRTEAVACLAELVLIDGSQYLVYGLLHQTVYNCRYSQQAHLAIVFGYFYPFHWVRTVRTVHQGTNNYRALVCLAYPRSYALYEVSVR